MKRIILFLFICIIIVTNETFAQSKQFLNIEYAKVDTTSLKLDLYLPNTPFENIPLIVWIHGGAWIGGDKSPLPNFFNRFLARGYAAASINYRLSQEAVFPAQINDCKAAIRWLRANAAKYKLKTDSIGVWGSSAGGHLVAMLGTAGNIPELEGTVGGNLQYSSAVQAVCDWFGPSDLLREIGESSSIDRTSPDCPEAKLIGGKLADNPELANAASPIFYASFDDPPFLIFHGTVDNHVPYTQSVYLDSALRYNNVPCTFIPMVGCGHGWTNTATDTIIDRINDFFDKYIKNLYVNINDEYNETGSYLQVTPNPASSIATINYYIGKPTFIELELFNCMGKEIAILDKIYKKEGDYRYDLDLDGLNISDGFYYINLSTLNDNKLCKLLVIR